MDVAFAFSEVTIRKTRTPKANDLALGVVSEQNSTEEVDKVNWYIAVC